jgi:hypothetical protein
VPVPIASALLVVLLSCMDTPFAQAVNLQTNTPTHGVTEGVSCLVDDDCSAVSALTTAITTTLFFSYSTW